MKILLAYSHIENKIIDGLPGQVAILTMMETGMPQLRILVVEDDNINQRVLKHTLALLPYIMSFEIIGSGDEAVATCKSRPEDFDFILMDVGLGPASITGIEAAEQIRAHEKSEELTPIPICALTGDSAKEPLCFGAGMNAFMLKPMTDNKLVKVLEDLRLL